LGLCRIVLPSVATLSPLSGTSSIRTAVTPLA
jgi:hypothetical protein